MSQIIISYNMFISSPSDVKNNKEIQAIREVVHSFNRTHWSLPTRIYPVRWDSETLLKSGTPLQTSIDPLIDQCDFLIAIFRARLGTPIDGYESGTAKEILTALKEGKQVFVYTSQNDQIVADAVKTDLEQYSKLQNFLKRLGHKKNVYVDHYINDEELKDKFSHELDKYYRNVLSKQEIHSQTAEKMRSFGITYLTEIGTAPKDILSEKIRAASVVKILSTTARQFFCSHIEDITEMLRRGGELKLLIPSPGSVFLEDVHQIEQRHPRNSIHAEIYTTLDQLRTAMHDSNGKGNIFIGCCHTLLRQTETICINEKKEIWAWTTLTMPPLKASGGTMSLASQYDRIHPDAQQTDEKNLALACLANTYFDKLWEFSEKQSTVFHICNNSILEQFYENPFLCIKAGQQSLPDTDTETYWEQKFISAKNAVLLAKKQGTGRFLIEIAAQHPLTPDGAPNEEFTARLEAGIALYQKLKQAGLNGSFYIPGSLHMDERGRIDRQSLSAAGTAYLIRHAIPADCIYGEAENIKYKGASGVYNSADECFVAAQIWKDNNFEQLVCVCSPEQTLRKAAHYIAFGVYPLIYAVPVWNPYHNYIEEMLHALPHVLYQDPCQQSEQSETAIRTRQQRRPEPFTP